MYFQRFSVPSPIALSAAKAFLFRIHLRSDINPPANELAKDCVSESKSANEIQNCDGDYQLLNCHIVQSRGGQKLCQANWGELSKSVLAIVREDVFGEIG